MKKKFIIAAAIAALALVGGYLGKAATDRTYSLSDLQISNAEALAEDENPSLPIPCHSSGDSNTKKRYTDCSTCKPVLGYKAEGTEALCYPK